MALRECPECTQSISTAATACPQCGCPLRAGEKKRSYLGPLLLILVSLWGVSLVGNRLYESPSQNRRDASTSQPPRCDADKASQLVQRAVDSGVFHRIEGTSEFSHVYILEPWRQLTIDDKKLLDNVVQCTVTNGGGKGPAIVVYHDGHSGKELATSNRFGFTMD